MHSKAISTWKYIHQHHPIPSNNTKEQKEITRKYKKMRHRWRPFSPSCLHHINTTLIHQHKIQRRKCKIYYHLFFNGVFVCIYLFLLLILLFFSSSGEGAFNLQWAWLKTHTQHQPHNTPWRDPHQQHSVHMHTTTHQCSSYLKVLSTSLYPSISITSRYLSNCNLNLSTVSAATTFPGRPFHALTTLSE